MNPPLKLRHGDTLATLYDRFNAVIDYLTRTRIVAGNGIRTQQLPAGTVIESAASAGGGASAAPPAGGMFRVSIYVDADNVETVSITSGSVLLDPLNGMPTGVAAGTLTRTSPDTQKYVLLICGTSGWTSFAFGASVYDGYTPGQQISWPLARIWNGPTVEQLWQGGMIDFTTRYYIG